MTENFNPKRPQGSSPSQGSAPQDSSQDALAQALESLIEDGTLSGESSSRAAVSDSKSDCPSPDEWIRLAMGDARSAQVASLMAHAALCRTCAAQLRQSQRLFAEEASPEESAAAAALASSSPQWQHELAFKLANTSIKNAPARRAWGKTARFVLWPGAALAATLVLSVGLSFWWQRQHTPERLLAEAYSHARGFDLRLPGADYGDLTRQARRRGTGLGHEQPQLLEARKRINQQLASTPNDPHWLQLEARADVLEQKYDPAIAILDHLLTAEPVTPSLLVDDANAYFQRGTCSGSDNDRSVALEYLRRADELAPGDPVVLFNEAVTMEDCGQLMSAVETWNRYLNFEHDSHWQSEGRMRLQALEQRLNALKTHTN